MVFATIKAKKLTMTDQDGCGNVKGINSLGGLIIAYSLLTPDSIA
jgi:hypothetical protein